MQSNKQGKKQGKSIAASTRTSKEVVNIIEQMRREDGTELVQSSIRNYMPTSSRAQQPHINQSNDDDEMLVASIDLSELPAVGNDQGDGELSPRIIEMGNLPHENDRYLRQLFSTINLDSWSTYNAFNMDRMKKQFVDVYKDVIVENKLCFKENNDDLLMQLDPDRCTFTGMSVVYGCKPPAKLCKNYTITLTPNRIAPSNDPKMNVFTRNYFMYAFLYLCNFYDNPAHMNEQELREFIQLVESDQKAHGNYRSNDRLPLASSIVAAYDSALTAYRTDKKLRELIARYLSNTKRPMKIMQMVSTIEHEKENGPMKFFVSFEKCVCISFIMLIEMIKDTLYVVLIKARIENGL